MATKDYLKFIDKSHRKVIVLAEIEPRQAIDVWTLRSGVVYQADWETFVQPDVTPGGMYREILTVEEDGVELTRVTNQLDLSSTPGSWFYSPLSDGETFKLGDKLGDKLGAPSEVLLVHTTDSTDPTDKLLMRVTFRVYFSTVGIVHDSIYYEPRLTGDQLPTLTQESEDLFFGLSKKVAHGAISLNNADGLFDKLAAEWVWRNARVNLYVGGDELTHQAGGGLDYVSIGQMLVDNFVPALGVATLNVRDIHKITLRQLPPNYFSVTQYPNMDERLEGTPIPLLFGYPEHATGSVAPIRVDGDGTMGTTNTYVVADSNLQTLYAINEVYANDIQIGATFIESSLVGCSFAIYPGHGLTLEEGHGVTCNAVGQPVLGKPWESSTDYLKNYGEIVSHIYTQILGLDDAEIDAAAAVTADTAESAIQGFYLKSQQTARVLIRDLERGVLGRTVRNAAGLLAPSIWAPGIDASTARSLKDPEVVEFESIRRTDALYSRVNVQCHLSEAHGGALAITYAENLRTKQLYLDNRDEELILVTKLMDEPAAKRLADRVAFMTSNPDVLVRVVENGIRLMDQSVGDRIFLTLSRAPSLDGMWEDQIFEIDKIVKQLAPVPRVEVTLNNLRGVGRSIGIWTNNVVPAYTSATENDKAVAGWWVDANNEADPGDPSSRNVSIWW